MQDNATLDDRVGYATTGLLLEFSLLYLRLNPRNIDYLIRHDRLKWYQEGYNVGGEL